MDGIAVIDKPAGWTSHDVVAKSRGILKTKKIGHSGTLDPDATGVLVLGIGRATKLLRYLQLLPKSYVGEIQFGVETSTLDAAGEVTARFDMQLEPDAVRRCASTLVGDILQVPPMVSAVKVGGKRLHELARQGIEIDRDARPVTVYRFDVEPTEDPLRWRCWVECSSGTYVRVLAQDLGRALGGGAHLCALRRSAVGAFDESMAVPLDALDESKVYDMVTAVRGFPMVTVDAEIEKAVRQGAVLDTETLGVRGDGPWPVLSADRELIAMYERHHDRVKPSVVFAGP